MKIICANPGIHKVDLANQVGLSWSSVAHHLRVLERDGRINLVRVGRTVHATPVTFTRALAGHLALVHPGTRRTLALLFSDVRGHGATDLGRQLGLTRKQVRRHLHELVRAGLAWTDGAYHPRYYATADGRAVVARLRTIEASPHEVTEATPDVRTP